MLKAITLGRESYHFTLRKLSFLTVKAMLLRHKKVRHGSQNESKRTFFAFILFFQKNAHPENRGLQPRCRIPPLRWAPAPQPPRNALRMSFLFFVHLGHFMTFSHSPLYDKKRTVIAFGLPSFFYI